MPRYLLSILFLVEIISIAFLTNFMLSKKVKAEIKPAETAIQKITPTVNSKPLSKSNSFNFLLLGYGGAGHDGGNLSDVLMVVNLNNSAKTVTFISVPRDLWVEIPVRSDIKENYKINAAYAIGTDDKKYGLKEPQYRGDMGGGNMAKKVVSDVTGLTINNFAAVDFENYKKIIDTLGGVEVEVPNTFDDFLYPVKGLENETCNFSPAKIQELHQKYSGFDLEKQFICRYEHLHFDKGKKQMDGDTALKFVRSRHSSTDGGDFARSRRQIAVINAVIGKLLSKKAFDNAGSLYSEFKGLIKTDLELGQFENLIKIANPPSDYKVEFISLNEENVLTSTKSLNGQFILIPKAGENIWNGIHSFIIKELSS